MCEIIAHQFLDLYSKHRPIEYAQVFGGLIKEWKWESVLDPEGYLETKVKAYQCQNPYWESLQQFIDRESYYFSSTSYWKYVPIRFFMNPISTFYKLISLGYWNLELKDHIDQFKSCVYQFQLQLDLSKQLIEEGIKLGFRYHRSNLRLLVQYLSHLSIPSNVPSTLHQWFKEHFLKIVSELQNWIEHYMLKYTKQSIGIYKWPNYKEMYSQSLYYYSGIKDYEYVKQLGTEYVKQLVEEQLKLIKQLNPSWTKRDFLTKCFQKSSNRFKSETDLQNYASELLIRIEKKIFQYIKKPSFYKRPILHFHQNKTQFLGEASYGMLAKGGAPCFYLNLSNWSDVYRSHLVPILLHEALPGHCFSYEYKFEEQEQKPKWAEPLYFNEVDEAISVIAESFLDEPGLLNQTNEEYICQQYSRLEFLLWRAVRCIVDVNLHIYGYSKSKCIKLMKKYLLWSDEILKNEIDRYCDFPGQSCSYFIGYVELLKAYKRSLFKTKYDFYNSLLENQSYCLNTIVKNIQARN